MCLMMEADMMWISTLRNMQNKLAKVVQATTPPISCSALLKKIYKLYCIVVITNCILIVLNVVVGVTLKNIIAER